VSRTKHTEAEMIGALKQLEAGRRAEDVAREVGASKHTIYAWKAKYGGMLSHYATSERRVCGLMRVGKWMVFVLEKIPNGYRKKKEFATRYKAILALANNKKQLERLSTKTSPRSTSAAAQITVTFPRMGQNVKFIGIDDIDSFLAARRTTSEADETDPGRAVERRICENNRRIGKI